MEFVERFAHYIDPGLIKILIAFAGSVAGGWLTTGLMVWVMRRSIGYPRVFFRWSDIWIGGTERAIATALVIWAPSLGPAFIGGWTALKLAVNWRRQTELGAPEMSSIALVGSAFSFAVAVGAGIWVNPALLTLWTK